MTSRSCPDPADARAVAGRNHWVNHLLRHAWQQPDRTAVRFQGASTSWRELARQVTAVAAAFAEKGVVAGDRVALLTVNRPEFLVATLAAGYLGAIVVPLNYRLTAREVGLLLDDADPALVVVDHDLVDAVVGARTLVVTGGPVVGERGWEAMLGAERPTVAQADVPEDSAALIMYTSGTTGVPKGAVLTHVNLQAQALTSVRAWRMVGDDEVHLIATPLFHIGGIGNVIPTLLVGGTMVIHPSGAFDAASVLAAVEEERVTGMFLVPSQWQALCEDAALAATDVSSLRAMVWGAAPATDVLLRAMADCFPAAMCIAVFGQTEMSPVTCVLDGDDAVRKLGSVGRPVSTLATRVVDEMVDVAPDQVGEIVYRGPTQMAGYWRNPEATAEAFRGGWFHSGDLVRVDDEGFVYVVDRKKDMIITGGENVYCAEVENVLADHPDVGEVSVVGRPHPTWGETPVAVVVPRSGASAPDVEELRRWAQDRLASYKLPTLVVQVTELPRNASGKVRKDELRRRLGREGGPDDE